MRLETDCPGKFTNSPVLYQEGHSGTIISFLRLYAARARASDSDNDRIRVWVDEHGLIQETGQIALL